MSLEFDSLYDISLTAVVVRVGVLGWSGIDSKNKSSLDLKTSLLQPDRFFSSWGIELSSFGPLTFCEFSAGFNFHGNLIRRGMLHKCPLLSLKFQEKPQFEILPSIIFPL